jgi:hypothetical protein
MSEYKREISAAVAIAVLVALGIGALAIAVFPGTGTTTSSPSTETLTLQTTEGSTTTTAPWSYSILGQEPFLMVTPTNHTFSVPFDVTTQNYSINLTYSPEDSYAWLFSNGTQWASSARTCPPVTTTTLTGGGAYTVTTTGVYTVTATSVNPPSGSPPILTHISQVPCGEAPPGEWWALNGTLISQHVAISPSEVQMTIQPSSFPAHYTGQMSVNLNIQMPTGDYGLFLAVHIQEPNNPNFATALLYILYYMPVIVQSG